MVQLRNIPVLAGLLASVRDASRYAKNGNVMKECDAADDLDDLSSCD